LDIPRVRHELKEHRLNLYQATFEFKNISRVKASKVNWGTISRAKYYAGKNPETSNAKFYYHQHTKECTPNNVDAKQTP